MTEQQAGAFQQAMDDYIRQTREEARRLGVAFEPVLEDWRRDAERIYAAFAAKRRPLPIR